MSGRRYRWRGGNSLGSLMNDSLHNAAQFGPIGALATGTIGFAAFYAILRLTLMAWADANKAKQVGPAAAAFAGLLDQVMWKRFIGPCKWAGIVILLASWAIAAWKALASEMLSNVELGGASWTAKLVAKSLQ